VEPETATWIAAIALAIAAVAATMAVASVVVIRRLRMAIRSSEADIARLASDTRSWLTLVRAHLDSVATGADRAVMAADTLNDRMARWSSDLSQARMRVEHLTQGRLEPMFRLMRLAGIAARVVYLWR
jgi:hypothetical protein